MYQSIKPNNILLTTGVYSIKDDTTHDEKFIVNANFIEAVYPDSMDIKTRSITDTPNKTIVLMANGKEFHVIESVNIIRCRMEGVIESEE